MFYLTRKSCWRIWKLEKSRSLHLMRLVLRTFMRRWSKCLVWQLTFQINSLKEDSVTNSTCMKFGILFTQKQLEKSLPLLTAKDIQLIMKESKKIQLRLPKNGKTSYRLCLSSVSRREEWHIYLNRSQRLELFAKIE